MPGYSIVHVGLDGMWATAWIAASTRRRRPRRPVTIKRSCAVGQDSKPAPMTPIWSTIEPGPEAKDRALKAAAALPDGDPPKARLGRVAALAGRARSQPWTVESNARRKAPYSAFSQASVFCHSSAIHDRPPRCYILLASVGHTGDPASRSAGDNVIIRDSRTRSPHHRGHR